MSLNPSKTLFRSQQAAYANTSQISNPTLWDEILGQFKEKLHEDLETNLGVHFKASMSYSKPYPSYFDYMKALMVGKCLTFKIQW